MMNKDFRIVFMGTPDFAVGILDGLIANNFNVVASITAPDKPAGRGQKIAESAVKMFCVENNIPVLQPTNLKDETFVQSLRELHADLFVVVAFRMLPEVIWNMPPKGTINLHASLLPQYRGAAPINWAIVNGEKETGVTTFFIEKEIDTGMVIESAQIAIGENETAGELHDKLMNLGRELVVKSVAQIEDGSVVRTSQNSLIESNLNAAPKIFKPMCEIDWSQSVQALHNFCRGFSPYPTAWTTIINEGRKESRTVKVFRTEKTSIAVENSKTLKKDAEGLLFPCNDFYLRITEIQPEGKRRMTHKEFAAGYNFNDWRI
jgi:methionyl-tRNA formyltransferase